MEGRAGPAPTSPGAAGRGSHWRIKPPSASEVPLGPRSLGGGRRSGARAAAGGRDPGTAVPAGPAPSATGGRGRARGHLHWEKRVTTDLGGHGGSRAHSRSHSHTHTRAGAVGDEAGGTEHGRTERAWGGSRRAAAGGRSRRRSRAEAGLASKMAAPTGPSKMAAARGSARPAASARVSARRSSGGPALRWRPQRPECATWSLPRSSALKMAAPALARRVATRTHPGADSRRPRPGGGPRRRRPEETGAAPPEPSPPSGPLLPGASAGFVPGLLGGRHPRPPLAHESEGGRGRGCLRAPRAPSSSAARRLADEIGKSRESSIMSSILLKNLCTTSPHTGFHPRKRVGAAAEMAATKGGSVRRGPGSEPVR